MIGFYVGVIDDPGMGITLTLDDLKGALQMPKELLIGFLLQYTVCSCPTLSPLLISQEY